MVSEGRHAAAVRFTDAELRLIPWLPTDLTIGQIADRLGRSVPTVRMTVIAIYRKLGAVDRQDAVRRCTDLGVPRPVGS